MPKPSKPRPVQPCAGADSEGLLAEQGRRQLAKNVFQVHGVDAYSPRSSSNANSLWRHALAEPTQVVTESQIHGSHADSRVRVLRGQPASPVSTAKQVEAARNAAIPRHFADMVWSPCAELTVEVEHARPIPIPVPTVDGLDCP